MGESMRELLPPAVVVVEVDSAERLDVRLWPEEAGSLGSDAVPKRRREFAAGRNCARVALQLLGVQPAPVLIGAHREPRWPPGIVGSITHTDGYCAVAVTWSDQVAGIGIDAEPHVALSEDLIRMVCTQAERQWIAGAARIDGLHWGTLFFSAKESIFKAWFPIAHRWLDFQDVELSIDVERRTFEVRLCVGGPVESGERPISFRGRFAIVGSYVMTATVAEVAQPASGTTPSERSVQLPRSKRVPGIECW